MHTGVKAAAGTVVFSGIMAAHCLQQFASDPSMHSALAVTQSDGYGRYLVVKSIEPVKARSDDLNSVFAGLTVRWKLERSGATSSIDEIVASKSYQQIIALGKEVVPLILQQLKREGDKPDHWFVALSQITGESPVPREDRGRIRKMADAWLAWGKSKYG